MSGYKHMNCITPHYKILMQLPKRNNATLELELQLQKKTFHLWLLLSYTSLKYLQGHILEPEITFYSNNVCSNHHQTRK